jgi:glycosyltransferase involved in cell wall biosynthesis
MIEQPLASRHLVLIPSYNPGPRVVDTVRAARESGFPVWVVIDGSDDGSTQSLQALAREDRGLRLLELARNSGKGSAVLHGLRSAAAEGFTHVLTMDADGQHPAQCIGEFIARSRVQPGHMVLGVPQFAQDAPRLRVGGRRVSNWWANLETLGSGIGDSLFGFRVYPIAPLLRIMERHRWMRRFDFDPEAAVRLCWSGVMPLNVPAPVRYWSREQGGVSHFRYLRDNLLLTWMHIRLMTEFVLRLPLLTLRRPSKRRPA